MTVRFWLLLIGLLGGCIVAQVSVGQLFGDQAARQLDYFIMAGVVAYGVVYGFFRA